jgi:hypothetical protein
MDVINFSKKCCEDLFNPSKEEIVELADKPSSVKFVRKQTATIIHLGQQSLTGSSNTPDLKFVIATVLMVNLWQIL